MMSVVEVYVLCKSRSKELALAFLEKFIPSREACADEYPYPEFDDEPKYVYDDVEKLLDTLESEEDESYSLYWNAVNNANIQSGMLSFTEDGQMIVGLAVDEVDVKKRFEELASLTGGEFGYISLESAPAENQAEFVQYCKDSDQIRMVEGELYLS